MNKKIEPGCRAVIVDTDTGMNGKEVVVLRRIGSVSGFTSDDGDYWEVDKKLLFLSSDYFNMCSEKCLKRIDDYDGNKKVSWDSLKGIYTPAKISEKFTLEQWAYRTNES